MVCYSRAGQLEGRRNLELPPLQETVIRCKLNEEDAAWYRSLQVWQLLVLQYACGCPVHVCAVPHLRRLTTPATAGKRRAGLHGS